MLHRPPSVDSFLDMSLFSIIMYDCRYFHGEYRWYVFLTDGIFCFFKPCDHKFDFDTSLLFEI